jgi:hypothetical protein
MTAIGPKPTPSIEDWGGTTPASIPPAVVTAGWAAGEVLPAQFVNLIFQIGGMVDRMAFDLGSGSLAWAPNAIIVQNPTATPTSYAPGTVPNGTVFTISSSFGNPTILARFTNNADARDLHIVAQDTGTDIVLDATPTGEVRVTAPVLRQEDGPVYVQTPDASGIRYGFGAAPLTADHVLSAHEGRISGTWTATDAGVEVATGDTAIWRMPVTYNQHANGAVSLTRISLLGSGGGTSVTLDVLVDGVSVGGSYPASGLSLGDVVTAGLPIALNAGQRLTIKVTITTPGTDADLICVAVRLIHTGIQTPTGAR